MEGVSQGEGGAHDEGNQMTAAVIAHFWSKVERRSGSECWLWSGGLLRGYGRFYIRRKYVGAHRFAYELLVGPIPDGLTLDHLCRVRACVNPAHLEPVTTRENWRRGESFSAMNARKTHCLRGHAYDEENTLQRKSRGGRLCAECKRERERAGRRMEIAA